jgi:hypothetical protein
VCVAGLVHLLGGMLEGRRGVVLAVNIKYGKFVSLSYSTYFPYFEQIEKTCEITLLSVYPPYRC